MKSPLQIKINKNQVIVEDFTFPRGFVEKHFPQYWDLVIEGHENKKVEKASYVIGDETNGVHFTDGTFKQWPKESEPLNEFGCAKYEIKEHHQEVLLDQKEEQRRKVEREQVSEFDIFKAPFNKRAGLIKQFNLERQRSHFFSAEDINAWLKNRKNEYLRLSDWTQLPDVNLTEEEKEAWRKYRDECRVLHKTEDPVNQAMLPIRPDQK